MALGGVVGSGTLQAQTREASLRQAIEQLDPIAKQLMQVRGQLQQLLDRVFGPHPNAVDEPQEIPPASMIASLNARAAYLTRVVEDITVLTNRLDQVL